MQLLNTRIVLAWSLWLVVAAARAQPATTPSAGLRQNTTTTHALVHARIYREPGRMLEDATLVIREGILVDVGVDLTPPDDARVWDLSGKSVYAGFIDAYSELSPVAPEDSPATDRESAMVGHWNWQVAPQTRADRLYESDQKLNRQFRSQGIALRLVAPTGTIVRGTSSLVTTADDTPSQATVVPQAALHLRLKPVRRGYHHGYPTSPMGALALVRQSLSDAQWYRRALLACDEEPGLVRPEPSPALAALDDLRQRGVSVMIDAVDELYFLRADRLAREFQLNAIVRGSGEEYQQLDAILATGRPVVVPLDFPRAPDVATPEAALNASLHQLMHWDLAPENPGRLVKAGVTIALTAQDLAKVGDFLPAVRTAVRRGLGEHEALRALTVAPAELFGVADRLGTLDPGKAAHLVVTDGNVFHDGTKVSEVWIDGRRHEVSSTPRVDVRGEWEIGFTRDDDDPQTVRLRIDGSTEKLKGKLIKEDWQLDLSGVKLSEEQFSCRFVGKPAGFPGVVQISATVKGSNVTSAADDEPATMLGSLVWANGSRSVFSARQTEQARGRKNSKKRREPAGPSLFDVNYPLGAFGRSTPKQPPQATLLFRDATVWTCGEPGILTSTDVLVERGRIAAIGPDLDAPAGALVLDSRGKHLSPGLIDCHSHTATDGGTTEAGRATTGEVRIGDFIDNEDVDLYRQLAAGVTTANILPGSDVTIGGQNQVIKLRWGTLPEAMKFAGAPSGIKFALGENVKQGNAGEQFATRYPQTRMGVEQLVLDSFRAARHYRQSWMAWRKHPRGLPPRVDFELAALAEVLDGRRWIHCHAYRQDEMLAFLRICSALGVRVGTLQHAMEGYKVADVLAQQQVGASAFSDWWAYKFEVFDAIPYNGTMLHRAGVLTSFNSDDPLLACHLNTEAAKAIKYGGLSQNEALQFVTLNPARQLRIDDQVGSIEVGKHADLVLWSGSPLSTLSLCEQTWIDGRKYFDRQQDLKQRARAAEMHAALVQKILALQGDE